MHEKLTEKFLSMGWNKNWLTQITTPVSEDTVVSILNNVFPEWTFTVNLLSENRVAGTLFLPGYLIDFTGTNEFNGICNIINKLATNVNGISTNQQPIVTNASEAPKTTTASVMAELSSIKAVVQQNASERPKNDAQAIFDDLMNSSSTITKTEEPKKEESEYLQYGTPECDAHEKQFWDQVNQSQEDPLKTPTPEQVNPNHELTNRLWTTETGTKLQAWMKVHNVNGKEQMSAWFMRYCGLDYDYFNPEWVDKFIAWTDALRERQTY